MYNLGLTLKMFSSEVGRLFGITLQAVTNAVRGIEKGLSEDKGLSREMALIKKEIDRQNV